MRSRPHGRRMSPATCCTTLTPSTSPELEKKATPSFILFFLELPWKPQLDLLPKLPWRKLLHMEHPHDMVSKSYKMLHRLRHQIDNICSSHDLAHVLVFFSKFTVKFNAVFLFVNRSHVYRQQPSSMALSASRYETQFLREVHRDRACVRVLIRASAQTKATVHVCASICGPVTSD